MNDLTHLSLFTGIGGFDLSCEAAGFRTVGQVEIDDYARAVLERHWPDVPKWRDIRTVTGDALRRVGIAAPTLVTGGFPCQPFSSIGQRCGTGDDRYLWPEMLRLVANLRPRWVVGENVAGFIRVALDAVSADLEREGYTVRSYVFPAHAVGAPHRRERCFVVGYADDGDVAHGDPLPKIREGAGPDAGGVRAAAPDAGSLRIRVDPKPPAGGERGHRANQSGLDRVADELPAGLDGSPNPWAAEWPGVPRVARGVPRRQRRLTCLGNSVVPAQVFPIVRAIADIERGVIR